MFYLIRLRALLLLAFLGISLGCSQPVHLAQYTDEELIDLVLDIQLANTAVLNSSKSLQDSVKEVYRAQVSQIHNKSYAEIDTIIKYVHTDLPRFNTIIDSVFKRVNRLLDEDNYGKKKALKNKKNNKK